MLYVRCLGLYSYISLFSSAGVGCFGLKEHGFICAATAELLERRINIQKLNSKCKYPTGYIHGDLTSVEVHERLLKEVEYFKKREKTKTIDLVIATPPCQGMSVANHKKQDELGRNSLVVESIKIINEVNPRFFVFENVSSFLKSECTDIDGVDKPISEAININLAAKYAISSRVINFKNYGSNSSRTRTLVIGVSKTIHDLTPLDLFPEKKEEKTLFQTIGHLRRLKIMGEFDPLDIYHSFRPYKENMFPWIAATPYGKSAFDNPDPILRPHQIIDGKFVENKSKNGDKYKRQLWEKIAPCIHTRNDCLPSQNTIHPEDNRVFSIRELMLMMSIPESFKWVPDEELPNNNSSYREKDNFRKKHDVNIRQCIGEAVPTPILSEIGKNIVRFERYKDKSNSYYNELINRENLKDVDNLISYLDGIKDLTRQEAFKLCELANSSRLETAAFYTRQDICYSLIESLPDFKKDSIYVLEPSVGVGNFLFVLASKYFEKKIYVDCIDINDESIRLCRYLAERYLPSNIKINYIVGDFLLEITPRDNYDIVIGNPPYYKINNDLRRLKLYQKNTGLEKTNNLFAFFIKKSLGISRYVSLIVPKALLNAPEYTSIRDELSEMKIMKINDYNEKAFDVKIETISITIDTKEKNDGNFVFIESYLNKNLFFQDQGYITRNQFNSWLLYRNEFFDNVCDTLYFGCFTVFRDRQLTKRNTALDGNYRVIKSRNIGDGIIIDIPGYDTYIDDLKDLAVAKFMNKDVILVPNLTYNPRAARLPKNSIADGSAAILASNFSVDDEDIAYFGSEEFNKFYRIARNFSTRSMNIDSVSVKYFGIKKNR